MNKKIFFADSGNPRMEEAFRKARETFKYFWREYSWEQRRIIPALNVSCIKAAFMQESDTPGAPLVEHMWLDYVNYNGETIRGMLINDPAELTNVRKGDFVEIEPERLSDWLFATQGKTCGGFTIQAMRSDMDDAQRRQHDEAWGLDFGDPGKVLLAYGQEDHPERLYEHPMDKNMKESLVQFVQDYPYELQQSDESGNSFLHRETIAGNAASVAVLLKAGADASRKNNFGKTALDYARQLDWPLIMAMLEP